MELKEGDAGSLLYDRTICRVVVHKVVDNIVHFKYEEGEKQRPVPEDPDYDKCFRVFLGSAKQLFKPDWMI